jgi:hypothetical protein
VRQFGYLPELYRDARSEKYKKELGIDRNLLPHYLYCIAACDYNISKYIYMGINQIKIDKVMFRAVIKEIRLILGVII